MPPRASRVLSVLRRPGPPQRYAATVCGTPPAASPPPVPRGPRSVRVMLSRTSSLTDLIRQSGELPAISRHPPVIGPVLDIHWIILSVLLTFRAFTAVLSRIAACNTPGAPAACSSVLPQRHWPSGKGETLGNSIHPANQLHAGMSFRRFIRSLSLRPSCLLAPRADQTGATFRPHRPPRAFTSGLSGHRVTPCACRISLRHQTENCAGGTCTR